MLFLLTAIATGGGVPPYSYAAEKHHRADRERQPDSGPIKAPLKVHPLNPRYFSDHNGDAVYLTGSHAHRNLVDDVTQPEFDYTAYLDFLDFHNHNFIRLWTWEHAMVPLADGKWIRWGPLPYQRTGPGNALDGRPKFDLTKFNQAYFDRLRRRTVSAQERGIYVSIMLFEGWSIFGFDKMDRQGEFKAWDGHPYNINNNVNGIDGDPNGDRVGNEVHTLRAPAVTKLQEAYVRKVIDTVNDLNNVLYEIANESGAYSTKWQYHMIRFIKQYETTKPKQHPVGMTFQWAPDGLSGHNSDLFDSPADWISPNVPDGYKGDPPVARGRKVIVLDTDHIHGRPDISWIWKSFLHGLNPIFMDVQNGKPDPAGFHADPVRRAMGHTLRYANRMNLAAMIPRGDLASSGYCLANETATGAEYLVYLPVESHWTESWIKAMPHRMESWVRSRNLFGNSVTVDLSGASGRLSVEWFNPATAETVSAEPVTGGAGRSFTAPFRGDAVLYISGRAH